MKSNLSEMHNAPAVRALILAGQSLWDEAHEAIQDAEDRLSAAVHAYLHRREGDIWNAHYWYRKAGRKAFLGSSEQELQTLMDEVQISRG
jgi:hypothetical protein